MSTTSTSKHAFTAGPWTFSAKHPQNACAEIYADDGCISIATCYGGDDAERDNETGIWGPQPTRDANARLIAEAGTVAHETGLTPRQLAERCKELEAALRPFQAACDYYSGEQNDEHCVDTDSVITLGHLREARAAIAKTGGAA